MREAIKRSLSQARTTCDVALERIEQLEHQLDESTRREVQLIADRTALVEALGVTPTTDVETALDRIAWLNEEVARLGEATDEDELSKEPGWDRWPPLLYCLQCGHTEEADPGEPMWRVGVSCPFCGAGMLRPVLKDDYDHDESTLVATTLDIAALIAFNDSFYYPNVATMYPSSGVVRIRGNGPKPLYLYVGDEKTGVEIWGRVER